MAQNPSCGDRQRSIAAVWVGTPSGGKQITRRLIHRRRASPAHPLTDGLGPTHRSIYGPTTAGLRCEPTQTASVFSADSSSRSRSGSFPEPGCGPWPYTPERSSSSSPSPGSQHWRPWLSTSPSPCGGNNPTPRNIAPRRRTGRSGITPDSPYRLPSRNDSSTWQGAASECSSAPSAESGAAVSTVCGLVGSEGGVVLCCRPLAFSAGIGLWTALQGVVEAVALVGTEVDDGGVIPGEFIGPDTPPHRPFRRDAFPGPGPATAGSSE